MFSWLKKSASARRPRCAALVAAAGSSSRMGGINKLLEPLEGVPVLVRTLTALQMANRVDEIIVATREEDLVEISRLCRDYGITKCTKVVRGRREPGPFRSAGGSGGWRGHRSAGGSGWRPSSGDAGAH